MTVMLTSPVVGAEGGRVSVEKAITGVGEKVGHRCGRRWWPTVWVEAVDGVGKIVVTREGGRGRGEAAIVGEGEEDEEGLSFI